MFKEVKNSEEMVEFGRVIGLNLSGGEIIELIGDVGAGKTTLVRGIAIGLKIKDNVQSPSFTVNRVYEGRDNIILSHYDFYRLNDAGIMTNELQESINDPKTVTVIEWGKIIENVLPSDRVVVYITTISDEVRKLEISYGGQASDNLLRNINL